MEQIQIARDTYLALPDVRASQTGSEDCPALSFGLVPEPRAPWDLRLVGRTLAFTVTCGWGRRRRSFDRGLTRGGTPVSDGLGMIGDEDVDFRVCGRRGSLKERQLSVRGSTGRGRALRVVGFVSLGQRNH
jgi:hypothetical protein